MQNNLYEKNGNILYILNVLKKYSNEANPLSSNEIARRIKSEYGVDIDSRTVRRNITLLIEKFDYDIETWSENKKGYFILSDPDKEFELGELSIIIYTFAYSNFIPDKISKGIIDKCLNMMNIYENKKYEDFQVSMKNTKTNNIETIKNIEDINNTIYHKRKIGFDYYKYSLDENSQLLEEKINDNRYKVSPYKLVYALQKFYLICLKDGKKELLTYRVDRMRDILILKEKSDKRFTMDEVDFYVKNNVSMFIGDSEKVEIECDMELLDNVIELYGKNITLRKIDDYKFYASFYTSIPGFKYWCLRNLEMVRVISPISLKKEIKKIVSEYLDNIK